MSRIQREQPLLDKESVGPALMVEAWSPSRATVEAAQELRSRIRTQPYK